jgi:predicted membrane metal-binding protein
MAHENLERVEAVEGSSNRAFGLVFAGVFGVVAAWPLFGGGTPRWWSLAIAAAFAVVALAAPDRLATANRLWMHLGVALGRIVSPVATAILFYLVFTPIGWLMRVAGKDPLRLRRDAQRASYWIARTPPGPPSRSFTNQF